MGEYKKEKIVFLALSSTNLLFMHEKETRASCLTGLTLTLLGKGKGLEQGSGLAVPEGPQVSPS